MLNTLLGSHADSGHQFDLKQLDFQGDFSALRQLPRFYAETIVPIT
jgi:hypothetical protein